MSRKQTVQIVWFKRDLRIHDHKPLFEAAQSDIPTLPLYFARTRMSEVRKQEGFRDESRKVFDKLGSRKRKSARMKMTKKKDEDQMELPI